MPAGRPWFARAPRFFPPPAADQTLYRVLEKAPVVDGRPQWGPLDGNPNSTGRFALPHGHRMFYVSDSPEGALWEGLLRYTNLSAHGRWEIPLPKLKGQQLARLRLVRQDVEVLVLSRPEILHLFPDGDTRVLEEVSRLLATPRHKETHPEAVAMLTELRSLSPAVDSMPMLRWNSLQFPEARVYLAFEPRVEPTFWTLESEPLDLHSREGMKLIRTALANRGFDWTPPDCLATSDLQDDVE